MTICAVADGSTGVAVVPTSSVPAARTSSVPTCSVVSTLVENRRVPPSPMPMTPAPPLVVS
jgi:hypothetical protein